MNCCHDQNNSKFRTQEGNNQGCKGVGCKNQHNQSQIHMYPTSTNLEIYMPQQCFQHKIPTALEEHGSHNSHPHRYYSKVLTFLSNYHNEQEKHAVCHGISRTVHAPIRGSGSQTFSFQIFFKVFSFKNQNLVSIAKVSSNIRQRQLLTYGAKNLLGTI